MSQSPWRWTLRTFAISLTVWVFLAIPLIYQVYMHNRVRGLQPRGLLFVAAPLWRYTLLATLTVAVLAMVRRFPIQRQSWLRSILIYPLGFVLFFIAYAVLHSLSYQVLFPMVPVGNPWQFLRYMARERVVENLWIYLGLVVASHAILLYQDARQRELDQAQLREELARQQIRMLRLQLHPHFIFNALHSISSLMASNVEAARTAIAQFSDLLRSALAYTSRDEVELQAELTFIEQYVSLEQLRLGDRLRYQIDVAPAVLHALVPTMVLQPLVENAIRHGIEGRRGAGEVTVTVHPDGERLRISVANEMGTGPAVAGTGLGLLNTRSRLQALYGVHQDLTIDRSTDRVTVSVTVPLKIAAPQRMVS